MKTRSPDQLKKLRSYISARRKRARNLFLVAVTDVERKRAYMNAWQALFEKA